MSIQAQELRIGNNVYYRTDTKCGKDSIFHKVTSSNIDCAASDGMIDFLEPIPLTPEILEKCGFEMFEKSRCLCNGLICFSENKLQCFISIEREEHDINILYLHQLQNLYFALTGTELEINL